MILLQQQKKNIFSLQKNMISLFLKAFSYFGK